MPPVKGAGRGVYKITFAGADSIFARYGIAAGAYGMHLYRFGVLF